MSAAVDYGYGDTSEPDYGYGDTDYGYGDDNGPSAPAPAPAATDYGYGDAAPTDYGYGDAAPTDYGYGDAAPTDYGYGDAAPAPPAETKRPKRRCSVTRYSLVTPANGALNAASVIQDFRKGANAETLNENGDISGGAAPTIADAAASSDAPAAQPESAPEPEAPEKKKSGRGFGKLFGRGK